MIRVEIPGFGLLDIHRVISDFSGTQTCGGVISEQTRIRLLKLSELLEIHIITSDTFGTAQMELAGLPVTLQLLTGEKHDEQKQAYVQRLDPKHVAAFGNGNNDRLLLKAVKDAGGLAVAVDNGEGCAFDAIQNANILVHGSENALDLLLSIDRSKATLRF